MNNHHFDTPYFAARMLNIVNKYVFIYNSFSFHKFTTKVIVSFSDLCLSRLYSYIQSVFMCKRRKSVGSYVSLSRDVSLFYRIMIECEKKKPAEIILLSTFWINSVQLNFLCYLCRYIKIKLPFIITLNNRCSKFFFSFVRSKAIFRIRH